MNPQSTASRGPRLRIAGVLAPVLLIAACASTPPAPTAALQSAREAIAEAERADGGHYAGAELAEARTKLTAADGAVSEKQMLAGERLAEQSRAEAELASARTASLKAGAVNDEMQHSNTTLIEEMHRNAGDQQ
jgi:hypothetical protein